MFSWIIETCNPNCFQTQFILIMFRLLSHVRLQIIIIVLLNMSAITCTKPSCERLKLPRHVRISENGPVLKVFCPFGLRPLEVDAKGVIMPSPARFARFVCVDGQYRRVYFNGVEKSRYFCADEQAGKCPLLKSVNDNVILTLRHVVARVEMKQSADFRILYCTNGKWHDLDDEGLPLGIQEVPTNGSHFSAPLRETRMNELHTNACLPQSRMCVSSSASNTSTEFMNETSSVHPPTPVMRTIPPQMDSELFEQFFSQIRLQKSNFSGPELVPHDPYDSVTKPTVEKTPGFACMDLTVRSPDLPWSVLNTFLILCTLLILLLFVIIAFIYVCRRPAYSADDLGLRITNELRGQTANQMV
ncbi:unnamed protein product [Calicophoron daubneyi]|uniref:Uncharacterized protein n=1 Tax=Calicophoron daubneyi TaxID=300641 RepID=A0AAV2TEU7_CALDB